MSTGLGIIHQPRRGRNASWLDASGRWKIERDAGVVVLRDLVTDPTGATDVSATEPATLATMTAELAAFEASVAASATCADLPNGECFFTQHRKPWHEIERFQPYLAAWCQRPEFDCQGSYP